MSLAQRLAQAKQSKAQNTSSEKAKKVSSPSSQPSGESPLTLYINNLVGGKGKKTASSAAVIAPYDVDVASGEHPLLKAVTLTKDDDKSTTLIAQYATDVHCLQYRTLIQALLFFHRVPASSAKQQQQADAVVLARRVAAILTAVCRRPTEDGVLGTALSSLRKESAHQAISALFETITAVLYHSLQTGRLAISHRCIEIAGAIVQLSVLNSNVDGQQQKGNGDNSAIAIPTAQVAMLQRVLREVGASSCGGSGSASGGVGGAIGQLTSVMGPALAAIKEAMHIPSAAFRIDCDTGRTLHVDTIPLC